MTRPDYAIPFADLFRELTPAERRELTESIRANGVMVAVNVYTSAKHGPSLLDGANRWAISGELGVPCPVNDLGTMSDKDARELAEQLNHCRRHLTPADWREMAAKRAERIKRVAEKRQQGKTLKEIADEEGVSRKRISDDLTEALGKGLPTEPEAGTVTGKDGKTYKATKPAKPAPEPVIEPDHAPPAQTAQPDTDYAETEIGGEPVVLPDSELSMTDPTYGRERQGPSPYRGNPDLPGAEAREYHVAAKEAVAKYPKFRKWVLALSKLNSELADLMKGAGTYYLRNMMQNGEPVLVEVRRDYGHTREAVWAYPPMVRLVEFVKSAIPHKVCAACQGHGNDRTGRDCPACGAVGYLPVVPLPPKDKTHLPFSPAVDPWEIDDLPED